MVLLVADDLKRSCLMILLLPGLVGGVGKRCFTKKGVCVVLYVI